MGRPTSLLVRNTVTEVRYMLARQQQQFSSITERLTQTVLNPMSKQLLRFCYRTPGNSHQRRKFRRAHMQQMNFTL